jgi:DNA-directed RNA polymerase subunit RPC12/RpoP
VEQTTPIAPRHNILWWILFVFFNIIAFIIYCGVYLITSSGAIGIILLVALLAPDVFFILWRTLQKKSMGIGALITTGLLAVMVIGIIWRTFHVPTTVGMKLTSIEKRLCRLNLSSTYNLVSVSRCAQCGSKILYMQHTDSRNVTDSAVMNYIDENGKKICSQAAFSGDSCEHDLTLWDANYNRQSCNCVELCSNEER